MENEVNIDVSGIGVVDTKVPQEANVNIPLIYTNGLAVTLTVTDIQIVATMNGKPQCVLALPLSAGKSLSISLQKALNDYESKTGKTIPELDLLNKQLNSK